MGAQSVHIEELKAKYVATTEEKLPHWLKVIPAEDRITEINTLNETNVFRSQFRSGPSAQKSPLNITEWGLNHIESLRT